MDSIDRPSPNFGERKGAVELIVLHYTAMPDAEAALQRLVTWSRPRARFFALWTKTNAPGTQAPEAGRAMTT